MNQRATSRQQGVFTARRTSFGSIATTYDAVRPEWPAATITWLLGSPAPDTALRVVDLGCGTGKASRALVALGHEVDAVDPSEGMLAVLDASRPSLPPEASSRLHTHVGGAEHIPLPGASADAVTAFQAWHWFDPDVATRECARVLRPGGWLSMAWHHRDDTSGWGAELSAIVQRQDHQPDAEEVPPAPATFRAVETTAFPYRMRQSVEDLVRHAGTWSFVAISPERERMLAAVRELGASVADSEGMVEIPMRTWCYRLQRC